MYLKKVCIFYRGQSSKWINLLCDVVQLGASLTSRRFETIEVSRSGSSANRYGIGGIRQKSYDKEFACFATIHQFLKEA